VHRFITQWPITENKILPQFIGFVTQDQPKELVVFYENMRESFRKRAEGFERELEDAAPAQLDTSLASPPVPFAGRCAPPSGPSSTSSTTCSARRASATRRRSAPSSPRAGLAVVPLPRRARPAGQGAAAGRQLGARQPAELFPLVHHPDDELRRLAAAGKLHEPQVLEQQTRRMLQDPRLRSLAVEFGTQWIHVRGFDELKEKNEALFPTFNDELRKAIYEESILFFQDLFQHDRPVTRIIDADDTYLNETLAKHYGIPASSAAVAARRGVKKYGRGECWAGERADQGSRGVANEPVLRGNWVVETLLGEKLPRPPANVPRLPEDERGNEGLTVRQLVAKHTSIPECAVCHVRIDPFGFALERYDPIGRRRDRDLGGLPIDTHVKLKDGNEFDGIDGLRQYC